MSENEAAVAEQTDARLDGPAERVLRLCALVAATGGSDERLERPFAAIADRKLHDPRIGHDPADARRHRPRHPGRCEAALEAIGRDDDLHGP